MLILISIILTLVQTLNQNIQTFGLLTVTHTREGDYSSFEDFLTRYAETECYSSFIEEINVIWNNQQSPEEAGVLKGSLNWRIPVNFLQTPFNSLNHRFKLPPESKANLLFSIDDDIKVDCKTFLATFQQYKKNAFGDFGWITTNQVRSFDFSSDKEDEFKYMGQPHSYYYTFPQTGAEFVPRHYLQLYYLNISEVNSLREIVETVTSCEDMYFASIVQHFYPQIPSKYVFPKEQYKNTDPKVGLSREKNVFVKRDKCVNKISQIFGYNPLRFVSKKNSIENLWKFDNIELIINEKIKGLGNLTSAALDGLVSQKFKRKFKKTSKSEDKKKEQELIKQNDNDNYLNEQDQVNQDNSPVNPYEEDENKNTQSQININQKLQRFNNFKSGNKKTTVKPQQAKLPSYEDIAIQDHFKKASQKFYQQLEKQKGGNAHQISNKNSQIEQPESFQRKTQILILLFLIVCVIVLSTILYTQCKQTKQLKKRLRNINYQNDDERRSFKQRSSITISTLK